MWWVTCSTSTPLTCADAFCCGATCMYRLRDTCTPSTAPVDCCCHSASFEWCPEVRCIAHAPQSPQPVPRLLTTGTWTSVSPSLWASQTHAVQALARPPSAATCPALNGSHRGGGPHMQPEHSSHPLHGPLIHHDLGSRSSLLSRLQPQPRTRTPDNNMQPGSPEFTVHSSWRSFT